ncbi:AtpZ/AtpI family protein [Sunxiuqinia elliptica]|uniref:AtpZ/AtpI family protein n=1 Tax=Sunxiuqinia elliptica TaxID=655355 RepID=UPI000B85483F|nr:putative F0F1-ATPase subunit (Ca2+/Mg2+ transporter) [Sunxiuqinia elliptica]
MINPKNLKKPRKKFDHFIRYSSLAFEMVAIMALGVFAGYKIDHWLDLSFPAFTFGLMILSVIGAIYHAIKNFLK